MRLLSRWICITVGLSLLAFAMPLHGAEPVDVDVLAEVVALKQQALELAKKAEALEAKLNGAALRAKPLKPEYGTPEQTFATFQHAYAQKNWKVFAECYAPKTRTAMVQAFLIMTAFPIGPKDESQFKQAMEDLEKLLAKHTPPNAQAKPKEAKVIEFGSPEFIKLFEDAAGRIPDQVAFIADFMAFQDKWLGGTKADLLQDKLVDLTVDGDTAQGKLVRAGAEPKPVKFRKLDGAWRME